jgi:hypothetical protein
MGRSLVGLSCAVLFTLGAVAFVLKPRAVAMRWEPVRINNKVEQPVIPKGVSFAPCEPMLAALGSYTWQPPQVVFTPGLETRAECAVLRAESAADRAWFALTGRVGYGSRLKSLQEHVAQSLQHG